jgi:Protein of unknown function (DUF3592)
MDKLVILIAFVFGVLLCAFGGFWLRLGQIVIAGDRQIALEGVDGQAEITDHRIVRGRRTSSHYITFNYTVKSAAGQPEKFTQETEISGADYQRLNPGDTVEIRYLPKTPKEVMLRGDVHEQSVPNFMIGGLGGLAAGAVLIIICIITWLR